MTTKPYDPKYYQEHKSSMKAAYDKYYAKIKAARVKKLRKTKEQQRAEQLAKLKIKYDNNINGYADKLKQRMKYLLLKI